VKSERDREVEYSIKISTGGKSDDIGSLAKGIYKREWGLLVRLVETDARLCRLTSRMVFEGAIGRPALGIEDKVLIVEDRGFIVGTANLLADELGGWDGSGPFLVVVP